MEHPWHGYLSMVPPSSLLLNCSNSDARIVDENINASKLADRQLDIPTYGLGVAAVGLNGERTDAVRMSISDCFLRALGIADVG